MTALFPFGAPSTPRPARVPTHPCRLFVLGVYPSALHVRWDPPEWARDRLGMSPIGALAVADEPVVFWDGLAPRAETEVAAWKQTVSFRDGDGPGCWGSVRAAGNGTSGRPVVERVLSPLCITPDEAWFTDAVNEFFVKRGSRSRRGQADAVEREYLPFAEAVGLAAPTIPARPPEDDLVALALRAHRDRLRGELHASEVPLVVTLGEEARRVLAGVADDAAGPPTSTLSSRPSNTPTASYGAPGEVTVDGYRFAWRALVHPGQRSGRWADIHAAWMVSLPG